jgi:hypothetical protein
VAVENEAVTSAHTRKLAENTEPFGEEPDLARSESLLAHPAMNKFTDLAIMTDRAVDIAKVERELHHVFTVDQGDHVIGQ